MLGEAKSTSLGWGWRDYRRTEGKKQRKFREELLDRLALPMIDTPSYKCYIKHPMLTSSCGQRQPSHTANDCHLSAMHTLCMSPRATISCPTIIDIKVQIQFQPVMV